MGFIDSYKRLEKLCGDVMQCDRPVTAYIDAMKATPRGAYYVFGWESDLRRLKHYRWVRNQIVHEPDCTEETMCEVGDAAWINQFYERILTQTDPLALYEKEMGRRRAAQTQRPQSSAPQVFHRQESGEKKSRKIGSIVLAILLFATVFSVVFVELIRIFGK